MEYHASLYQSYLFSNFIVFPPAFVLSLSYMDGLKDFYFYFLLWIASSFYSYLICHTDVLLACYNYCISPVDGLIESYSYFICPMDGLVQSHTYFISPIDGLIESHTYFISPIDGL